MTEPFSLLVIADTQYLFDGARQSPELLSATFEEAARLQRSGAISPIVHIIHVGDVTEHGRPEECRAALDVLRAGAVVVGDEVHGAVATTVATGNHDVDHGSFDDRGTTPFVEAFGPGCELLDGALVRGPVQHGPGGYSTWRTIHLPNEKSVGVLALDWRPTAAGWSWATRQLTRHGHVPTIVVSHDVASQSCLTPHGAQVQDLVAGHPQVFLVLGGHEWPSTRVVTPEREFHAVNYQELPFGGAGAARIYDMDPRTGYCQVVSICPALRQPQILRSVAARRLLALARAEDQFSFPLPLALGGNKDVPWQAAGMELAVDIFPHGVEEFDGPLTRGFVIEVECLLPETGFQGWQVLLTRLGAAPDSSPEPLAAMSLSSENFLGWMAFVDAGETWATSHEYSPGAAITIVVNSGDDGGMWIDGDLVGRSDPRAGGALVEGAWRWRVGAGEYAGGYADEFRGTVRRVRFWTSPDH